MPGSKGATRPCGKDEMLDGVRLIWTGVCIAFAVWSVYLTIKVADFVHAWPF